MREKDVRGRENLKGRKREEIEIRERDFEGLKK